MDKFMYIIEYTAPYSEYGGTISVIAKDDEEAMSLLRDPFGDAFDVEHFPIVKKFRLAESLDSRIVVSFTT